MAAVQLCAMLGLGPVLVSQWQAVMLCSLVSQGSHLYLNGSDKN